MNYEYKDNYSDFIEKEIKEYESNSFVQIDKNNVYPVFRYSLKKTKYGEVVPLLFPVLRFGAGVTLKGIVNIETLAKLINKIPNTRQGKINDKLKLALADFIKRKWIKCYTLEIGENGYYKKPIPFKEKICETEDDMVEIKARENFIYILNPLIFFPSQYQEVDEKTGEYINRSYVELEWNEFQTIIYGNVQMKNKPRDYNLIMFFLYVKGTINNKPGKTKNYNKENGVGFPSLKRIKKITGIGNEEITLNCKRALKELGVLYNYDLGSINKKLEDGSYYCRNIPTHYSSTPFNETKIQRITQRVLKLNQNDKQEITKEDIYPVSVKKTEEINLEKIESKYEEKENTSKTTTSIPSNTRIAFLPLAINTIH